MKICRLVLIAILVFLVQTQPAPAGDWPQILGPDRDGASREEQVRRDWGGTKPKEIWQREVGEGLAGVAVAGGQVVLFHREGDEQVVEAMDAASGDVLWTHRWP
ncbi:MAG: hypothetical protein ACR2NU_16145, partial [Aeoliella sp.]